MIRREEEELGNGQVASKGKTNNAAFKQLPAVSNSNNQVNSTFLL